LDEYISKIDLQIVSNQTLAFIGDAVFNVYIRSYLASKSYAHTGILHKQSVRYVSAKAQSRIMDNIVENLSEDEVNIYKRGRNANVATVSKNVDVVEYKKATGFEALIGELYLQKKTARLEELVNMSIKAIETC